MKVFSDPTTCKHPRVALSMRPDKNGRARYQRQCQDCWQPQGDWISRETAARELPLDKIPSFDEARKQKAWDNLLEQKDLQIIWELKRMKDEYQTYLNSDAWRSKRELVMARANGKCEGCGIRQATQVHHFTYDNLGNELLWELAAVCDECHERSHPWKLEGENSIAEWRRQRLHKEIESSPLFREKMANIFKDD